MGTLQCPAIASWMIKKLCKVKETLSGWMKASSYSIEAVYRDLMGSQDRVTWAYATWSRATIPKSHFIVWLACQDRLKTKQKLMTMGVVDEDTCPICDTKPETKDNLYFKCEFSRQCVVTLRISLSVTWNIMNLQAFHRKHRMPRAKRRIIKAVIANIILCHMVREKWSCVAQESHDC